jgi:nucleoside-diphosphate-sugar epimerase
MHVEDVARALVRMLTSNVNGPVNVGSGEPTSIAEAVSELARRAGRPDSLRLGALPPREDDVPSSFPISDACATRSGFVQR